MYPGRGNESMPGDGSSPNFFSTVSGERGVSFSSALKASLVGTTHWNWRNPLLP